MWPKETKIFFFALAFLMLSVAAHLPVQLNGTATELTNLYQCSVLGDSRIGCFGTVQSLSISTRTQKADLILLTTTTTTTTAGTLTTTVTVNSIRTTRSTATNSASTHASTSFTPTASRGLCFFAKNDILTPCNVQIPTSSSSATVKSSAGSRSICNPISPIYRLFSRQVISNHNNTMNLNENKEGTGIGKGPLTNTHLALLAIGFIIILGFGTSYACQLVKRWRRNKRVSTSREETVNHDASAIEFTGMCGR